MKRFWETALPVAAEGRHGGENGAGWTVRLDGNPVRVPEGAALLLGTRALAEAVAAEWQRAGGGQGGEASWDDLPLTRIAGTAQARVALDPEGVALEIARYGQSDLLCYRAERPEALVRRQAALWQPWVEWARATFGADLRVTAGISHVAQRPEALACLAGAVRALPVPLLAGLGVAVPALGSLVLGLAMAREALSGAAAFELSVLDELFQAELWGDDAEASRRRARLGGEVESAGRFMALAR